MSEGIVFDSSSYFEYSEEESSSKCIRCVSNDREARIVGAYPVRLHFRIRYDDDGTEETIHMSAIRSRFENI